MVLKEGRMVGAILIGETDLEVRYGIKGRDSAIRYIIPWLNETTVLTSQVYCIMFWLLV